jgi:hypothetical protein
MTDEGFVPAQAWMSYLALRRWHGCGAKAEVKFQAFGWERGDARGARADESGKVIVVLVNEFPGWRSGNELAPG